MSEGHALSRDELVRVLTSYKGVVTTSGAADGSTLIDSVLIGKNDFITGKTILIGSGPAINEDQGALSFNSVTGQITFSNPFSAQITQGTIFRIINISSVESLIVELARYQGLCYWCKVTAVISPTQFDALGIAGKGNSFFNDYRAYVVRDAAGLGAAPQGEQQPVSAYVSATARFTHLAYTVGLAVDDEILLLHPEISAQLVLGTTEGVYAHPSSVAEETAFTIAIAQPTKVNTILLNLAALTQNATIRVRWDSAGAGVYEAIETFNWTVAMDNGVFFREITTTRSVRVTIQSAVLEGAPRNIPYEYSTEA